MMSIPLFFMPLSKTLPASGQPVSEHPLSGRLGHHALPHALLNMAGPVLMPGLLAGYAASGTGGKMAFNDSDRSAQPATKGYTIVFEFGFGLSGPTKKLSTNSSTNTLPSQENADYVRRLPTKNWPRLSASQTRSNALPNITIPGLQPLPTRPNIRGSSR